MTIYVGQSPVKAANITQSWGLNPGTAELVCVGSVAPRLDEEVWFSIGGTAFRGYVKGYQELVSKSSGVTTTVRLVDERIKLQKSSIYAQFNMIREDGSMYKVLPDDWALQQKTEEIFAGESPSELINWILVGTGFTAIYSQAAVRSVIDSPANLIANLDWNGGKKKGAALLEICDNLGIHFALYGVDSGQLLFARKSETVKFLTGNFTEHATGRERVFVDDRIRIVGDPNIYELQDIALEPDWLEDYNPYVFDQHAGLIQALRVIDVDSPWSVTVSAFADEYGEEFRDTDTFAGHDREDILVMDYVNEICFKVYRIPDTSYNIAGNTYTLTEMLPLHDRLASDVDAQVNVKATSYIRDPRRPLKPVELVDSVMSSGYQVDRKRGKIIFSEKKFKELDAGWLVQIGTQIKVDVTKIIAITPLLSFSVLLDIYHKDFGSGSRAGSHHIRNLRLEYVCNSGGVVQQTFDRGIIPAYDFASNVATMILSRSSVLINGFAKRAGTSGYVIADRFNRITVSLDASEGIQEQVTYTNEEPNVGIPSERAIEKEVKAAEPISDLAKEFETWDSVVAANALAKSVEGSGGGGSGSGSSSGGQGSLKGASDVVTDLPSMDPGGLTIPLKASGDTDPYEFGDCICMDEIDETTGQFRAKLPANVDANDPGFLGVVIKDAPDGTEEELILKSSGFATVKVEGVVAVGDQLGLAAGASHCVAGGAGVGIAKEVNAGGSGFVRAKLGAGGGSASVAEEFFQIETPDEVEGKINRWYKPEDPEEDGDPTYAPNHYFIYSFDEGDWIDIFGWAGL
jgi:hypothetical protein